MDVETSRQAEAARRERFTRLTAAHHDRLRGVALRCCCRDRAVADDLVQDTYERAWRGFDSLQDESRAMPWLVRILRNCWIDICRKNVRSRVQIQDQLPDLPSTIDEPSPWEQITVDDYRRAIEQLPEPFRSVAILHDVDRLSNSDIAHRLAVPYGTVATRLHRARKLLSQLLRVAIGAGDKD